MMTQTAYVPVEFDDLAEGLPHEYGIEPDSHLKTTTLPVVVVSDLEKETPSEGSTLAAVDLSPEGKDDDDAQDAAPSAEDTQKLAVLDALPDAALNNPPVVLIIEDTTELAEVIQATLERMKMVTLHETHGAKALARFDELNPDVVLLDISLPDMTGWKIMDVIKERHELPGNKARRPVVIVITAYGDPANRLVGKLQGVHSYLIKPFTSDEIERVVTSALQNPTKTTS
ncbi:MAG: response regulator [bacterium]|nr:response regulator [bacterium]